MFNSMPDSLRSVPTIVSRASPMSAAYFITSVLPGWTDLTEPKRANLASSLRSEAHMMGMRPEDLILSCVLLNKQLFKPSAGRAKLTDKRRHNARADLRFVLRRLGEHAPDGYGAKDLSPEWSSLYKVLPTPYRRVGLVGFFRFCDAAGLQPNQVESTHLAAYEVFAAEQTLCENSGQLGRTTLSNWNWAFKNVPAWPIVRLERPGARDQYCLPLSRFPQGFQDGVGDFGKQLAFSDPLAIYPDNLVLPKPGAPKPARNRGRKAARPRTVEHRRFQLRQLASALVRTGLPIEHITSLRTLVDPLENAHAILTFFYERAHRKKTTQTASLAEVLRQVGKFHCSPPPDHVEQLAEFVSKLSPPRDGMTAKNRQRLRALVQPGTQAMLLHLPQQLMERADDFNLRRGAGAVMALRAVALEILLICPMRIDNLRTLRLDRHCQRLSPGKRLITHLIISGEEVKNGQPIEWPVPKETALLIDRYLRLHRPLLSDRDNGYLFPGERGGPRSVNAMHQAIAVPAADHLGVELNPHLMRHYAAWRHLRAHPGAYPLVQRVLGHRDPKTTISFYTGLEAEFAAAAFDAAVIKDRKATSALAKAGFQKGRRPAAGKAVRRSGRTV